MAGSVPLLGSKRQLLPNSLHQPMQFLRYKAALSGIPITAINPACTGQDCRRCGQRNTPDGQLYVGEHCRQKDHRDANPAFNLAQPGVESLGLGFAKDSGHLGGSFLVTPSRAAAEATHA